VRVRGEGEGERVSDPSVESPKSLARSTATVWAIGCHRSSTLKRAYSVTMKRLGGFKQTPYKVMIRGWRSWHRISTSKKKKKKKKRRYGKSRWRSDEIPKIRSKNQRSKIKDPKIKIKDQRSKIRISNTS
jgi:hypothetical protein